MIDEKGMRIIGEALRRDDWQPIGTYACGCNPNQLCGGHSVQRAVEHYHGEPTR